MRKHRSRRRNWRRKLRRSVLTTEALKAALLDAANDNRVAEYGDDYVDQEMMDWAKDVLGVGDAFGKIDEVRETVEPASE